LSPPWRVEEHWGKVAHLHATSAALLGPDAVDIPGRRVRILHATDVGVVLGSGQPEADVDRARAGAAGFEVVRRRSGGGAVLVGPGRVVWIDVIVPRGDGLWEDDVGRAFWWLGDLWVHALASAGLACARAWRGGLRRSPWSRLVCFAGLGPGEVTIGARKVVGMAQRRTRQGALFQCALPVEWDPLPLLDVLALDERQRKLGAAELAAVALGVGVEAAAAAGAAFVAGLPGR
jgi:lipoate-protein ligase A